MKEASITTSFNQLILEDDDDDDGGQVNIATTTLKDAQSCKLRIGVQLDPATAR